jgi:4-amino-4-deoxy-L-arabinose transferase-like glycosyltransferase
MTSASSKARSFFQWPKALLFSCFVIVCLGLCSMVVFSPRRLVFDEPYHLEGTQLLANGGTIPQMLTAPLRSAPGPLYPVLYWLSLPFTQLEAPAVRYVNLLFLAASVCVVTFSLWLYGTENPWVLAGMMFSVPMVWVTGGIALTETPALLMAALSLAVAMWIMTHPNEKHWVYYLLFALSGVFCGLAVLGRQTSLPMVGAFLVVALAERRWRWPAAMAFLIAAAIPLPVFITWGGLVPRSQAHVGGGVDLTHGFLAFSYLAFVFLIIAPRFFLDSWRWSVIPAFGALLLNVALLHFRWHAMGGIAKRLPPTLDAIYPIVVGSIVIAIFAGFGASTVANLWQRRHDRLFIFFMGLTVVLTGTAFGVVHSFSSLYVLAAFPFVLFAAEPFFKPSRWAAVRLLVGSWAGAISLGSYYW